MSGFSFVVPTIPVAQPRQRVTMIAGKPSNYTPTNHPVNAFKAACQSAAVKAYTGAPLEGPLRLAVWFYLPRPKNMMWKTKPTPAVPHAKKPDSDNLVKAVKDSLSKIIWRDDAQISEMFVSKLVVAGDGQPKVIIEVEQLEV